MRNPIFSQTQKAITFLSNKVFTLGVAFKQNVNIPGKFTIAIIFFQPIQLFANPIPNQMFNFPGLIFQFQKLWNVLVF